MLSLLAFDTATEHMSIALRVRGQVWSHDAPGGAQASATLIPAIMALLGEAGSTLAELDAIAFGRGPGAFTGLRTACAVAQGLAFGSDKPVLPVDTLLAVAEDARSQGAPSDIWVVMDARMNEIYAAHYGHNGDVNDGVWHTLLAPRLIQPAALNALWQLAPPMALAGNATRVFGEHLSFGAAVCFPDALPKARAMLPLADVLWAQGGAVDAALALPLYLRDKVAQTTAERVALKAVAASATVA